MNDLILLSTDILLMYAFLFLDVVVVLLVMSGFVPLAPWTELPGRTDCDEFVSFRVPVDVAEPDAAATSRLVAVSSPRQMRAAARILHVIHL